MGISYIYFMEGHMKQGCTLLTKDHQKNSSKRQQPQNVHHVKYIAH